MLHIAKIATPPVHTAKRFFGKSHIKTYNLCVVSVAVARVIVIKVYRTSYRQCTGYRQRKTIDCNFKKLNMCFTEWMAILFIRFIVKIKGNVSRGFFFSFPFSVGSAMKPFSVSRNLLILLYILANSFFAFRLSIECAANSVFITLISMRKKKPNCRRQEHFSNKYCCYIGIWHSIPHTLVTVFSSFSPIYPTDPKILFHIFD